MVTRLSVLCCSVVVIVYAYADDVTDSAAAMIDAIGLTTFTFFPPFRERISWLLILFHCTYFSELDKIGQIENKKPPIVAKLQQLTVHFRL